MCASDLLEDAGYSMIEAADADLALVVLRAGARGTDILVTDGDMPGAMDGCTLARQADRLWSRIRIVIISGHRRLSDADVPHGRFVPKPWEPAAVVQAIARAGGPA